MVRHSLSCAVVAAFSGFAAAEGWPQWRGPDRTGISADTGLLKEWPKDGPPLRWKAADIGTGWHVRAKMFVIQGVSDRRRY
jgi:hypothetical protein